MDKEKIKKEYRKLVLIHLGIQLSIFLILFIVSKSMLKDVYLYKWTADRFYLLAIPLVVIFTFMGRFKLSYTITFWNLTLIIVGQALGDLIRNNNMEKIDPSTSAEVAYRLSHHYGFEIWFFGMIIVTIVALIIDNRNRRKIK